MSPLRNSSPIVVLLASFVIAGAVSSTRAAAVTYRWTNVPFTSPVSAFQAISVAPSDPSVVYAASTRGFFVSADAGATWTKRFDLPSVLTLAVDPGNPSTVWAGTGGGPFSPAGGLLKSTDRGASWTLSIVTPTAGQFPVYSIAIDPGSPSTVFAGTSVGLYRSRDGGAAWTNLTNGIPLLSNFFAVAIAPSAHSTIYAGTAYQSGPGVSKSTDGGDTWVQLNSGVAIPDVRALAVDARDSNVAYRSDFSVGISKTTDGGAHWSLVEPVLGILGLIADPSSPGTVYAAINFGAGYPAGLLKTTDGGGTWTRIENGLTGLVVQSLAVDPHSPTRLYAATTASIFANPPYSGILVSFDEGSSWQPLARPPIAVATVGPVAVDPTIPSTVIVRSTDLLHAMRSTDGGLKWQETESPGNFVVFDPRSGATVYTGSPLRKSIDAGATWSPLRLTGLGANVVALAIDPATSSTLYAVSGNGVFSKSLDAGATWTSTIFVQPVVSSLVADPVISGTLYAGDGIGLFESRDAGDTWFRVAAPWPELDIGGRVAVGVIGTDPIAHAVYVRVSGFNQGGVYRTSDGGATWSRVPAFDSSALSALAVDPSTGFLYAGTSTGVLRSTDDGTSWASVSAGLPGPVTSVAVDSLSSTVWAVSNGFLYRSAFLEDLACGPDPSSLCLNAVRFRVRAAWRTVDGSSGEAQARPDTSDTGAFWFFSANNIEIVVKVVDGRSANGHFWVFGAALSNVEYTLEVTDTTTGAVWTHHNPQGELASFADTIAF